jgi:uncharacterized protein YndB with AHSA1/START domain
VVNKKKWLKIILLISLALLGIFVIAFFLMVAFSPYGSYKGHDYKLVKTSIVIDAPVDQVFTYLGNSDNASEWSVFVDHITTLNSDKVPDGQKGSVRRCFENANEKGKSWDEKTTIVEPNKRRQLSCYNYKGFGMTAGPLLTEQLYEDTKDGKCVLSFTLFFPEGKDTFFNRMKMYYGAYEVADVFEKNLRNIKKYNEQKQH